MNRDCVILRAFENQPRKVVAVVTSHHSMLLLNVLTALQLTKETQLCLFTRPAHSHRWLCSTECSSKLPMTFLQSTKTTSILRSHNTRIFPADLNCSPTFKCRISSITLSHTVTTGSSRKAPPIPPCW